MKKDQKSFPTKITRRIFLAGACIVGIAAALPKEKRDMSDFALRPPGAGLDFLSKCIRCGKCVEACPYDCIRLADMAAGKGSFAPYIDPIKTPCYLCREASPDGNERPISAHLKCGEACPTGALKTIPNDLETLSQLPDEIKIGTAKIDRDLCLAWKFGFCCECYLNCPLKDKAALPRPINGETAGAGLFPDVDPDSCTGCGRCVFVCPVRRPETGPNVRSDRIPGYLERHYGGMVKMILARNNRNDKSYPAIKVQKRNQTG